MPKTVVGHIDHITQPIPRPLAEEIDRLIRQYPKYGYNRTSFVVEAVREKIMRLKMIEEQHHASV